MTKRPWLPALLALLAAVPVVGYLVALVVVLRVANLDQRHPADAVVVLGAAHYDGRPSPVFQARLDHALLLYQAGLAQRVILTGGRAEGDTTSEAAAGSQYLLSHDVPAEALIVRATGRSTSASMRDVADWLQNNRLSEVLLVSDPFHMARLRVEARRHNLTAYLSPTHTSPISNSLGSALPYYLAEAWKVPVAWVRSW